jgi:hypothetical protein
MDVEAIARRIAQDHGVTVLEKDVIETLEKLKAANKEKITGAGEAQVPSKVPEVSPITSASTSTEPVNPTPTPLPTSTDTSTEPVKTPPEQSKPASEPATDTTKPATEHANAAQNEASKLVIPTDVKPLPIDLIDDLIKQNFSSVGIEKILKASGHNAYRKLINERMKIIKPLIRGVSSGTKPASTETTRVITSSEHVISGTEPVIRPPTDGADTRSAKTPENTGNSGISGTDAVAPPIAPLQTGSAPLLTSSAPLSTGASTSSAPLPTDLPNLLAAFQQFLAAYKQAPNTLPTASEQINESDDTYDSELGEATGSLRIRVSTTQCRPWTRTQHGKEIYRLLICNAGYDFFVCLVCLCLIKTSRVTSTSIPRMARMLG